MAPLNNIRRTFVINGKTTGALLIIVVVIGLPLIAHCIVLLCKQEWRKLWQRMWQRESQNTGSAAAGGN
jgi:hypothetical protein